VVGGYTADKVALRRAYALAYDIDSHIRLIVRGQGIAAHSPVLPHTVGYDPAFRTDASDYDPARARALLDMYGYIDRNGDGWRELPDGSPLKLRISSEPEQVYRLSDDLARRCLTAVGIDCEFEIQQWPAHYKQSQAGTLQIWSLGSSAANPDGQESLQFLYGPQSGEQNLARFKLPAYDAIYERMLGIPDGPERTQLFLQAKRIAAAYLPYRCYVHRIANDLAHPWVLGYRRPIFWNDWWHMVDVDTEMPRGA
jgi:ABC-type transport system substrate-binding protein